MSTGSTVEVQMRSKAFPPDEDHDRTGYIDVIGEGTLWNEANILNIVYLGLIPKYEIVPPTRNILLSSDTSLMPRVSLQCNKYRLAP